MLKTRRKYFSFLITLFLILIIGLISLYINAQSNLLSNLYNFINNSNLNNEQIINNKYNAALEGSVIDHIYPFRAKILAIKEHLILHKKISLSPDITLPENYPTIIKDNLINTTNNTAYDKKYIVTYNENNQNYNQYLKLGNKSKEKILLNYDEASKQVFILPESKQSNRFEGIVEDFKKQENKSSKSSGKLIPLMKNWDSSKVLTINKIKTGSLNVSSIIDSSSQNTSINTNVIRYSEDKNKFTTDVVKDFSKDPLKSVIQKVLLPKGLPKTPANVDAVARSMGLPSGSLGSSDALASSLGISIENLSNPNTKLPSSIVSSINKNKSYLGQELNVHNTTLGQFYTQALEKNLFSNLNNSSK